MKKLLIHCKRCAVLLLALTAAFAVGCTGDLEDDVADLQDQVTGLQSELEAALGEGKLVSNVTANSDGTYTVTFDDGSTAVLDGSISEEYAEFYLLEVAGDTIYAGKAGVDYPASLSMRGNNTVYPYLVEGKEYTFTVQVNPTDAIVEPTNFYLVKVLANEGNTKSSLLGDDLQTNGETTLGDAYEHLAFTSMVKNESYPNAYDLSVVYVDETTSTELLYISVEYAMNTYNESTKTVSTVNKEVLAATSLATETMEVLVTEDDVEQLLGSDDKATAIVINITEGEDYTFALEDMFLDGFISANLSSVALIKDAELISLQADGDYDYNTTLGLGASNLGSYADGVVSYADIDWTDRGTYKNATGNAATLKVTAPAIPDVIGSILCQSSYEYNLQLLFDDTYVNATYDDADFSKIVSGSDAEKVYTDLFGTVSKYADLDADDDKDLIENPFLSYVARDVKIIVHKINETVFGSAYSGSIPAAGEELEIVSTDLDQEFFGQNTLELSGYDSYAVSDVSVTYDMDGADYGYVLDQDPVDYEDYLESIVDEMVYARVATTPDTYYSDLYFEVAMANAEGQPVLPGQYTFTVEVESSNDDSDYAAKSTYSFTVELYAPQYTVKMNSDILTSTSLLDYPVNYNSIMSTYASFEKLYPINYVYDSSDSNSVKSYDKLKEYTTYEYYDFDLARFVDVAKIDSWSLISGDFYYPIVETSTTSTLYDDSALALYDPSSLRFKPEDAAETLVSTEQKWDVRLYAEIDGQEGTSNLVEVSPLATDSKAVSKKVTLYTVLESGLKVPVQLVSANYPGLGQEPEGESNYSVVTRADQGSFVVTVGINGLNSASGSANTLGESTDPLDYTQDLDTVSEAASDYSLKVTIKEVKRSYATFQNLMKDHFTSDNFSTYCGAQEISPVPTSISTSTWVFTDYILTSDVAYTDNSTTDLSDNFIVYVNTVDTSANLSATTTEATKLIYVDTYQAAYERIYADKIASGDMDEVYVSTTATTKVGNAQAQIGDGGSDRWTTVDLIASTTYKAGTVTYANGSALASTDACYGKTLIEVSDSGVVYAATTATFLSEKTYCCPITITVTDIVGNKVEKIAYVYFKF